MKPCQKLDRSGGRARAFGIIEGHSVLCAQFGTDRGCPRSPEATATKRARCRAIRKLRRIEAHARRRGLVGWARDLQWLRTVGKLEEGDLVWFAGIGRRERMLADGTRGIGKDRLRRSAYLYARAAEALRELLATNEPRQGSVATPTRVSGCPTDCVCLCHTEVKDPGEHLATCAWADPDYADSDGGPF